jgi:hypothetical protein
MVPVGTVTDVLRIDQCSHARDRAGCDYAQPLQINFPL